MKQYENNLFIGDVMTSYGDTNQAKQAAENRTYLNQLEMEGYLDMIVVPHFNWLPENALVGITSLVARSY